MIDYNADRRRPTRPGFQLALDFVLHNVRTGVWNSRRYLPSIRQCAATAGVSFSTMWQAMQKLNKDGIVAVQGRRFVFPDRSHLETKTMADNSLPPKTRRALDSLRNDIRQGVLRPGDALPTRKELAWRYGVSRPTLHSALKQALEKKLIEAGGRDLRVPASGGPHPTTSMQLVTLVESSGRPETLAEILSSLDEELVRNLEFGCSQNGMILSLVLFHYAGQDLFCTHPVSGRSTALPAGPNVLGYLLIVNRDASTRPLLWQKLAGTGLPVALLDEAGVCSPPPRSVPATFRIFTSSTSLESGRAAARLLVRHGHTALAYISPFHGHVWSQRRCAGLVDTIAWMSPHARVRTFTDGRLFEDYQFSAETAGRAMLQPLSTFADAWRKGIPPAAEWYFDHQLRPGLSTEGFYLDVFLALGRHFEKALADTAITAWVCANDTVAWAATRFCAEKNVTIPRQISVIGFDDSSLSVRNQITSYNFNIPSLARAILEFVRYFDRMGKPRRRRETFVEIEGGIVERATTGRAPGSPSSLAAGARSQP